ncbi:MAG: hydantoinase/oxoprolinase family protein [Gammaproteobacteria bacterium]
MKFKMIGWDIGGAHIKAALMNEQGKIIALAQKPCPLWQGIDKLKNAVYATRRELSPAACRHAVTMTGELVDLFENRDHGVKTIIETLDELLPGEDIQIYAGRLGFVNSSGVARTHHEAIASANWLASASFAAPKVGSGLFIDIGSTTTDILLLDEGRVLAEGYTDYQRLISKELVYTGVVRTAVMAVAPSVQDEGRDVGLMAEYFAAMSDVYRVTGELNERHDQTETADGAEKTVLASARRLSRMIGCDFDVNELPRWRKLAEHLSEQQLNTIRRGCEKQLARRRLSESATIVGAGVGRFLARRLSAEMNFDYVDFSELCPAIEGETNLTPADCAPAVAVASLACGIARTQ